MSRLDDIALSIACTYCTAEPGAWCRTAAGARARWLHGARTDPIYFAFSEGIEQGRLGDLEYLVQALQYRREGARWAMDVPLVGLDVLGWLQARLDREKARAS